MPAGALSPAAAKALHAQVNSLCRQLGADNGRLALALCEGFGIPDHLLRVRVLGALAGLLRLSTRLQGSAACPPGCSWRAALCRSCDAPSPPAAQAPIAVGDWRSFQG